MALIESAESLIALYGIDGVSVREIGNAIGSANNNVVSYHFGGKQDLVTAIYRHRLAPIDARRGELLAEADLTGCGGDVKALMNALWLPLYEQTNPEGWHSYARFLMTLSTSGWGWARATLADEFQNTQKISERLKVYAPEELMDNYYERFKSISYIVIGSLITIDYKPNWRNDQKFQFYEDSIRMCAGAFLAGLPAS